jgi:dynein light chain roadblock-type
MATTIETEDTLKRIANLPGVQGYMIINTESGLPIRINILAENATHYCALIHGFVIKAKATIRDLDHYNELQFIRLRSKHDEILIALDKDYTMIVFQKPKI